MHRENQLGENQLDPRLQLVPAGSKPRLLMFSLCVLLPLAITAAALCWEILGGGALKLIGGSLAITIVVVLGGVAALVLTIWMVLDAAMRRHRLQLSPAAIEVRTTFYSTSVPLRELDLEQARVIDLHERGGFTPRRKSNGYDVPGFKSGHFRLRNGDKAFVAIAGERRALWLPSTRGNGLLLQPQQPEALLKHLGELATSAARR